MASPSAVVGDPVFPGTYALEAVRSRRSVRNLCRAHARRETMAPKPPAFVFGMVLAMAMTILRGLEVDEQSWIQWQRRILVRWEYHTQNLLGFIQLACLIVLFRRF
jgi:hypothetical protein